MQAHMFSPFSILTNRICKILHEFFSSRFLPAGGAAEQGKHCQPHHCGYYGAHPVAEMAEVTVLNNSYDDGAAEEHGKLRNKEKRKKQRESN